MLFGALVVRLGVDFWVRVFFQTFLERRTFCFFLQPCTAVKLREFFHTPSSPPPNHKTPEAKKYGFIKLLLLFRL